MFSSYCFTMKPRWNHHERTMTYTEDMTHVTTPWLDRFWIFNAHAFTAITFLTNMTFLLWLCLLFLFLCPWLFSLHILSKQANTPLVLLSLDVFWIFNYPFTYNLFLLFSCHLNLIPFGTILYLGPTHDFLFFFLISDPF